MDRGVTGRRTGKEAWRKFAQYSSQDAGVPWGAAVDGITYRVTIFGGMAERIMAPVLKTDGD